jgi:hypothetical protein
MYIENFGSETGCGGMPQVGAAIQVRKARLDRRFIA